MSGIRGDFAPMKKIVVAYSGGLDTSVILNWLKEIYGAEIIAFCADVGQAEELDGLEEKALKTGAEKCYVDDLQEVVARNQDGERVLLLPSSPAELLPEGRHRAREPAQHDGVQSADVDAELERGRRDHRPESSVEQLGLDLAPLLRQVARAVGADGVLQLLAEVGAQVVGHQLGGTSRAAEHQGA